MGSQGAPDVINSVGGGGRIKGQEGVNKWTPNFGSWRFRIWRFRIWRVG